MKAFFSELDTIDSILKHGASRETASDLAGHVKDPASAVYVFNKLDASWLEPLESIGYFRDRFSIDRVSVEPPQMRWSASGYLRRIAAGAQADPKLAQALQRILSFVPSPADLYTLRDVVEATVLLPKEMRHLVVPFIQRSIGRNSSIEFSNMSQLLSVLAKEDDVSAALRVFNSVFSVFHSPAERKDPKIRLGTDPISLMNPWHYADELRKCLPTLSDAAGLSFLGCLCNLLNRHLQLGARRPDFAGPDDASYIWRPAIEEHSQNFRDDVRDALVTAIRDCATLIIGKHPAQFVAIVDHLESQQWFIFSRITLYLLASSPSAPLYLVWKYSTDPFMFSEVGVRHEYALLLKSRFRMLAHEHQTSVLKMIENGPDKQYYARVVAQLHNREITPDELNSYVKKWQYDWLTFIADDLPDVWKNRFLEFKTEFSAPDHPDFPFHMSSGFGRPGRMLSPPSPSLDNEPRFEDWLEQYGRPVESDEQKETSSDLVVERLRSAVQADAQSVISLIDKLGDLPPTFIAVIAASLLTSPDLNPNVRSVSLDLSANVAEQVGGMEDEESREVFRNSLTSVLDQCFQDNGDSVKADEIRPLKKICEALLATVTPMSRPADRQLRDDFDPLFWGINSTDGRILENSVKLALRERKFQDESTVSADCEWLFRTLSRTLDQLPNDEVRISAILGYRFPWLVYLSKIWGIENVDNVFPTSAARQWRWEASWCSYIAFSGVYNDMLEILRSKYEEAVDKLAAKHLFKKSRLDPNRGLAQHLAVYYWRQLLSMDDPLLQSFLKRADSQTIRSFLHELGSALREVRDIPSNVLRSLQVLADWMLSSWKPKRREAKKGLSAFGWWYSTDLFGDLESRLRLLASAARKAGNLDNIDDVLKQLELVSGDQPSLVIDCIDSLIQGDLEQTTQYFLASHSLAILEKATPVSDSATRAKISKIANFFGARGHFEYRPFA